jgi:cobalt/nickel transport system permease protein
MLPFSCFPLWAVHISDGILTGQWVTGGFVAAGLLAVIGAWRIRDEEIAQVALLTAAFFVASLVHVPVPPTSVHLLLNGLVGVVLGLRAAVAIPVGLVLQAVLIGHGGFTTLGVNSCVMVLPALLAWQLFAGLQRVPWLCRPWFRAGLVAVSTLAWLLSLTYSVVLLVAASYLAPLLNLAHGVLAAMTPVARPMPVTEIEWANFLTLHPVTLAGAGGLAVLAVWAERWLENAPEFPLGLLVGAAAVLATTFLNSCVLAWGGQENWWPLALLLFVTHLPIAVVEGVVLGFTVGFLVRVKPELLRWTAAADTKCAADPLP